MADRFRLTSDMPADFRRLERRTVADGNRARAFDRYFSIVRFYKFKLHIYYINNRQPDLTEA